MAAERCAVPAPPPPIGDGMTITSYFSKDLFTGKTVFVTGGASGINLGIARNFAAVGANVGICGRTQAALDAASEELRGLGARRPLRNGCRRA